MAHEVRHGYGYLSGELVAGGHGLHDQMDEVAAYRAEYLFGTSDAINMVAENKINIEWFKDKSNTNMTVKDAMDAANRFSENLKKGPEYRYGDLLKNRNL